jgi:hypothetical protein
MVTQQKELYSARMVPLRIGFLAFDQVNALDFVGPAEACATAVQNGKSADCYEVSIIDVTPTVSRGVEDTFLSGCVAADSTQARYVVANQRVLPPIRYEIYFNGVRSPK